MAGFALFHRSYTSVRVPRHAAPALLFSSDERRQFREVFLRLDGPDFSGRRLVRGRSVIRSRRGPGRASQAMRERRWPPRHRRGARARPSRRECRALVTRRCCCRTTPAPGRVDLRNALHERRMGGQPLAKRHPTGIERGMLRHERVAIDPAPEPAARGQDGQAEHGAVIAAGTRAAVAVAGVLTSPRQRGKEKRHQHRGGQRQVPSHVSAIQVSELVRDDHVPGRRVVSARVDQVGVQHDHVGADEARGERVQHAAALNEVHLRHAASSPSGEPAARPRHGPRETGSVRPAHRCRARAPPVRGA